MDGGDLKGKGPGLGFDSILSSLPDPVLVVDSSDDVVYVNGAAEQFFRGSVAMLQRSNLQDLIPHDSPMMALLFKVRRSGNSMTEHSVPLSTPRTGENIVSIDAAPIVDDTRKVVLVLRPETIAGKLNDSLLQRGAARSVSALSAMLAHEVKNPLSGIRGAAQLLEAMVEPEDRQLTKLIVEETDRIVKLLDSMEVFSDNPGLQRSPVNIHEVLDHVIQLSKAGFGKGVKHVIKYDPSLPPVFGNRDQLIQIFLNLVKNAVEAVESSDGEVTVTTSYRHGVRLTVPGVDSMLYLPLVVSIQDNGPGIPDDMRRHLFDPFISTKQGGSGLGLALVAKFVSDHGGVIDLDSRPKNTVFNVLLPMIRPENQSENRGEE
ncbi:two-component system sensor histidine kinase NtrB [Aestuariispira insulae]|uniref:histidine kinase n=1 Tax=Aestuariispira insulae TaxID=1461337 RepID=A0A3D9HV13_9PROT|nr:ATP-binding protein [Aestuariispira insulae]RED53255.1 two-component system nitrogen regulation sensor histidine kinase GlnL [Aestuariispira insulae]